MMARIERWILYVLFLTVGTYAVPELRVLGVPYTVPIAGVLVFWIVFHRVLGREVLVKRWLVAPTLLYVAGVFISSLLADISDWPLTFKYAAFGMIPLAVSAGIRDVGTVRGCLFCLMISSMAVFLYGVYGYFTGAVGDPIQHEFGYFGVTYMASTRNSDQLFFLVPFCVSLAVLLQGGRSVGWVWSLVVSGSMLALAAALTLSFARGAWIAMAVVGAVMFQRLYVMDRRLFFRRAAALSVILIVGASVWISRLDEENLFLLQERGSSLFTLQSRVGGNSNENRMEIAIQALETTAQYPLFGVGVGNARDHLSVSEGYGVNHAENVYLQLLIEHGLIGFLSYMALLVWTCRRLTQRLRLQVTPGLDLQLLAIFVTLTVYGVFNSFVDNTWYWTVMALVIAHANLSMLRPEFSFYPGAAPARTPQSVPVFRPGMAQEV